MATIDQLCVAGLVQRVKGVLGPRQMAERKLFLLPEVGIWMRTNLPKLEADGYVDGAVTPKQQSYQLFRDFVSGVDMFELDWHPKPLRPHDASHGVWELRTPDLRFFGWFCQKGTFVVSDVATKSELLENNSYSHFRERAVIVRNALALSEPKVILGEHHEVF